MSDTKTAKTAAGEAKAAAEAEAKAAAIAELENAEPPIAPAESAATLNVDELAARYTAGVDISDTELAGRFLADYPNGDPKGFLVALGRTEAEALEAVRLWDERDVADTAAPTEE